MIYTDNYYNLTSAVYTGSTAGSLTANLQEKAKDKDGAEYSVLYPSYQSSGSGQYYLSGIFILKMLFSGAYSISSSKYPAYGVLSDYITLDLTSEYGILVSFDNVGREPLKNDYTMTTSYAGKMTVDNSSKNAVQITLYNSGSSDITVDTIKFSVMCFSAQSRASNYMKYFLMAEHYLGETTIAPGKTLQITMRRPFASEVA